MNAQIEPIVGRYLRLTINDVAHRIYFEEAGEGTPLLCLHTAGADSRQYRAVLNDPEVLSRHRVITFDLPWHGRSSPPAGWENTEYRLTAHDYMATVLAVMEALQLDRPVLMGCSIGGRMALHMALHHPEKFRGIIGLQSGARVKRYFDSDYLHRADVNGAEAVAGIVSGLMSPTSPEVDRWETLWHYMQGGPGIFVGDLFFYRQDGDLTDRISEIDPSKCPLFLLTGEYDYSCSPEESREVAALLPGVELTIMKGLGHFPMSENPDGFLSYLRPVLAKIGD